MSSKFADNQSLYDHLEFNEATFARSLENKWASASDIKKEKRQFRVVFEYLRDVLKIKTILIEQHHISRSFLNDYAYEYTWGFNDIDKLCKRLHFFSEEFHCVDDLLKNSNKKLWAAYRGFITIKPLPKAMLGTVLLDAPPYVKKKENWAIREYEVVLLGQTIPLKSLAFQEQDELHSACATIAIWTALHMLYKLFRVALLTPHSINHRANAFARTQINYATEIGLDLNQICSIVEDIGLLPLLRTYEQDTNKDLSLIRNIIYAYSKMKLPILVGLELKNGDQHLITVIGMDDENKFDSSNSENKEDRMLVKCREIDTLFAHDDQTGPFTKVKFLQEEGQVKIIRWDDMNDTNSYYLSRISNIVVPLPKNVRISYEDVHGIIDAYFNAVLDKLQGARVSSAIVWDIYLSQASDYKTQVRSKRIYDHEQKNHILKHTFLPPYIWIARGYSGEVPFIEFVFNATAIPTAHNYCIGFFFFNTQAEAFIEKLLTKRDFTSQQRLDEFFNAPERKTNIWEFMIRHFVDTTPKQFGLPVD